MTSLSHSLFSKLEPALPSFPESSDFWMPTQASTTSGDVDWLYGVLMWISTVFAVAIFAAMIWFCVKYRSKGRSANETVEKVPDHNTTLEITWSVAPLVILIALFVWGFKGYVDLRTSPRDSMEIHVTGQKWKWIFDYPNGITDDVLHVPVNTNVRVVISAVDVLHSFWIPNFRVKMDAVPGRFSEVWFHATVPGEYPIECAEYCGTSHSDMLTKVIVHPPGGFEQWLQTIEEERLNMPPAELGKLLYQQQGCATCHSLDGTRLVGPTFKGIFGKTEAMADGSQVTVDENYIRESILEPQSKIVQGYAPAMPTFQGKLKDRELTALVEFIKSIQ